MTYPLYVSPVAALRAKYGLSRREAARRLGLAPRYLAVLEMRTKALPPTTLTAIRRSLAPPDRFTQITIWEALAELDLAEALVDGAAQGEGQSV
ncbi:MAG TPA: helix-turn-helix transcriptional regulator [Candidatus Elarobacter sp.]|jgi:transcriptional regulator with XRE-family HTH domain|nr:helix-turn-helix transcriptional regulator [Candidatus Elarobacter sp.]